jgi:hypothetical protein
MQRGRGDDVPVGTVILARRLMEGAPRPRGRATGRVVDLCEVLWRRAEEGARKFALGLFEVLRR